MSLFVKSVLMWLALLVAAVGNGVFRVAVLQPRLGEHLARQVATVLGVGIVFGLTGLFVRGLSDVTGGQLLRIGVLWLALTLAFEFLFGHYVTGASWEALLADYELARGRLWPLVLLTTLLSPWLWGAIRGRRTA